jgi:hypothetical protein
MVAVTYGSVRPAHAAATKAQPKTNFFSRLIAAMMEARLRQAYREIELHQHLIDGWKDETTKRR